MSCEEPKFIVIDEETAHEIVHRRRFGKTNGATHETFHPGPGLAKNCVHVCCTWTKRPAGGLLEHESLPQGPARWAVASYVPRLITCTSSLGRRKARYLAARFLTPPV